MDLLIAKNKPAFQTRFMREAHIPKKNIKRGTAFNQKNSIPGNDSEFRSFGLQFQQGDITCKANMWQDPNEPFRLQDKAV